MEWRIRMRIRTVIVAGALTLALCGCSQQGKERQEREAGRVAYKAAEKTEQGLKKAAREIGIAAEQAHQGWTDAKHEDQTRKRK
jgi:hypothetical protein